MGREVFSGPLHEPCQGQGVPLDVEAHGDRFAVGKAVRQIRPEPPSAEVTEPPGGL